MIDSSAATPPASADHRRFPCAQCGAQLEYKPGSTSLRCGHCRHENAIATAGQPVAEQDFRAVLADLAGQSELEEHTLAKCDACGAELERPKGATAFACPFCGADIVAAGQSRKLIKPHAVLPFRIERAAALGSFQKWLKSLWFAPGPLRAFARVDHRLSGMYVPHWTYDARTVSRYSGQRGDDYYVTETYTVTVNGRPEVRTRQVRHTRWTSVSGVVRNEFDDVLICATESLPQEMMGALEPWDLREVTAYRDEFLSGFRAESYQIGLEAGFERAQTAMQPTIRQTVCADIGGDHQRIESLQTQYNDIGFKHLLLPVWISAYRFRERVFRFLVNARTGEVRGERPYSAWKITFLVLTIVAAIAGAVWFFARQ